MKEFLELPHDSSGYGDFAVAYVGSDAKIQFEYKSTKGNMVGELYFTFCVSLFINGEMDKQRKLPHDTVLVEEYSLVFDGYLDRYVFMLSGRDFQFEVVAKNCTFNPSVTSGVLIER